MNARSLFSFLILISYSLFSMEEPPEYKKTRKRILSDEPEIEKTTKVLALLKISEDNENHNLTMLINEARLITYTQEYKEKFRERSYWIDYDLCKKVGLKQPKLYNDDESSVFNGQTRVEDLVTSTNWNTLELSTKNIRFPFSLFQHQLWIGRNDDPHGNDTTEFRFKDEELQEQIFIEPHEGAGQMMFDGPNLDNMVIIGMNKQHDSIKSNRSYTWQRLEAHAYRYYLLQLAGKKRLESIPAFNYESTDHPDKKITALALAKCARYALATTKISKANGKNKKIDTGKEHSLSVFSYLYNSKLKPILIARGYLRDEFKKIAFITNNTLMGLTKRGHLYTLWVDGKSIKYAPQNTPMDMPITVTAGTQRQPKIHDFAIDPLHSNQMIMTYRDCNGYNDKIAFVNLNFRLNGKMVYKELPIHTYSDEYQKGLYYYNDYVAQVKRSDKDWYLEKFNLTPFQAKHIKDYFNTFRATRHQKTIE